MTIEKIQNTKIITFKPKKEIKTPSALDEAEFISTQNQDKAPNDPSYYQAINKINRQNHFVAIIKDKNIKITIPFENKDSITLELDENDSTALLLNQNGTLDDATVDFFVELFKSFYKIRKDKFEKEKALLIHILEDKKEAKIITLNPQANLEYALAKNIATPAQDYIQALLSDIYDTETRKTLAKIYLNGIEQAFAKSVITVINEVMQVLKLSKDENGNLDKSNLAEKINQAVWIVHQETEMEDGMLYLF